jgi:hypothetical protein
MDLELRESLTQGFGPEPGHRPLGDRLEGGQRAVRRRRIVGAVLTVAVASVVGLGAVAVLGGDGTAPAEVATDPTPSPDATQPDPSPAPGWDDGELARYDNAGNLEVRPGVTVLERIDSPYPASAGMDRSVALALDYQGEESWLLISWAVHSDGEIVETGAGWAPGGAAETLEDWVAEQVRLNMTPRQEDDDDSPGYVEFGDDGRLVSSHGIKILDQVLDPGFKDFVMRGEPSAAALLQGPDGKKWYVAVRDSGGLDAIAVPFETGGPTLDDFVAYARQRYASGVGLR